MGNTEEKKKILYVITKSNLGGAQRYVHDLATAYADQYDVAVALGPSAQLNDTETLTTKLAATGIRTIEIPALQREISIRKEIAAFRALLRTIRAEQPDVLHLNSSKVGGLGAFAGRLARVPRIIFTAHGWEFNNRDRGMFARSVFLFLSWLTILLSHATITVSDAMRAQIRHLPFTERRTTVIRNGILVPTSVSRDTARTHLQTYAPDLSARMDTYWFGMIAELHPVKGIDVAIDAFAACTETHPDTTLVVCGAGEARTALAQCITERGLDDRVFLLGHVADAAAYLPAFDAFLFPSRSEGLGYALLEAGAAARPVIASDVGGIPEVITDGETGRLVAPGDTAALADALNTFAAAPERAQALGDALAARVQTVFTLERMVRDTDAIYTATSA